MNFSENPLWLNLLIFGIAAAGVWFAGGRLERLGDAIAVRTGLGKALVGLVLLAVATSLPEIATTLSAAWLGYRDLVVHNLLGGVAMQTAVLVIADAVVRRGALTRFSPTYPLIMQGVALLLMLAVVICWIAMGDRGTITLRAGGGGVSIGLMGWALLGVYLLMLRTTHAAQQTPRWRPVQQPDRQEDTADAQKAAQEASPQNRFVPWSVRRLLLMFALFAAVIFVAGWALAQTGEAIAEQTGIAASFIGATLVAIATSLPEVSTTVAAARHGNYSMAMANIFGSNMFDVMLLLPADLILAGSLFGEPSRTAMFTAGLGVALTCVYLWGMLEHRDRTVWGLGMDSAAVAVVYPAGVVVLYFISS